MPTELHLHHQDCLDGMRAMPEGSIDLVVTSPPYNLGIDYGTYNDTRHARRLPRLVRRLGPRIAPRHDRRRLVLPQPRRRPAQPAAAPPAAPRPHRRPGAAVHPPEHLPLDQVDHRRHPQRAKQISAGHFKPINSKRFVNDCHEFVFHLTKTGTGPARPPRRRRPLRRQVEHRPLGPHRRLRPPLPRQQLVHPLRHDQVPRQASAPTPPPSRSPSSSNASASTARAPRPACSTPSSASAPPPSRAPATRISHTFHRLRDRRQDYLAEPPANAPRPPSRTRPREPLLRSQARPWISISPPMCSQPNPPKNSPTIESIFVRHRNVLHAARPTSARSSPTTTCT